MAARKFAAAFKNNFNHWVILPHRGLLFDLIKSNEFSHNGATARKLWEV
jgi:hypothetical protein